VHRYIMEHGLYAREEHHATSIPEQKPRES
jgi:hypothetical protein